MKEDLIKFTDWFAENLYETFRPVFNDGQNWWEIIGKENYISTAEFIDWYISANPQNYGISEITPHAGENAIP